MEPTLGLPDFPPPDEVASAAFATEFVVPPEPEEPVSFCFTLPSETFCP